MIEARAAGGLLMLFDESGQKLLEAHGEARLSDGTVLSTTRAEDGLEWRFDADTRAGVTLRLALKAEGRALAGVEQLRPLVAPQGYCELPLARLRIHQTGWQSWSRAHPAASFEANWHSAAPPIRGPLLPHRRNDSQLEPWMTMLAVDDRPALLLGFTSARNQLGTIEIAPGVSGGHELIVAAELDGVALHTGAEIESEPILIAQGAPADLLDLYARSVAEQMEARGRMRPTNPHERSHASLAANPPNGHPPEWPNGVLTGWCSWYQLYTEVTEADVDRNVASLAAYKDLLPLRLIQLDDGYQRTVGDWLELLPKFPGGMRSLVERIRQQGYMPGLWLAPFLLSARSHTFTDHPEWVVRDERGEPLNAIDNWGSPNYCLDTTHPGALEWIAHVIRTVCDDWGFEYLKLDFVYAAAMRGRRHERGVTAVQAYRRGLELLREVAGERFVLGCGAPLLPSVGLVDGMRIGSDVAAYWGTEGNADGPSLRNATRATLARMWMHSRWWANDPDCVVVRATDTQLSLAEVQAWASVVALSGGMVFVGDDVSRVQPDRLELLARLLPPSGQAASTLGPLVGLIPERLLLRVERPWGAWSIVGLANWSDVPMRVRFTPTEFGLDGSSSYHVVDLWTGDYLGLQQGTLDLGPLAPHGMRLLSVHADVGRPQTIGGTGHLLGDAMDLAGEVWDANTSVLTLQPATNGPAARHGELIVFDPRGPIRRVPFTSAAVSRPIGLSFAG
jgi:alpha-galactosidase